MEDNFLPHNWFDEGQTGFSFEKLSSERLDEAERLCAECVGENLYPKSYLQSALTDESRFFYILTAENGELAGYIHFSLTDVSGMAALSKLPKERLLAITENKAPVIGNLQSIAVADKFAHQKLSVPLVRFYLDYLQKHTNADISMGVFWNINGFVPMEKTLRALGFSYLADAKRVWYDNKRLVCPYCKGRCECGASVYYKLLGGRKQ